MQREWNEQPTSNAAACRAALISDHLLIMAFKSSIFNQCFRRCIIRWQLAHTIARSLIWGFDPAVNVCSGFIWCTSAKPSPLSPYICWKSNPQASQASTPVLFNTSCFFLLTSSRFVLICFINWICHNAPYPTFYLTNGGCIFCNIRA